MLFFEVFLTILKYRPFSSQFRVH